MGISPEHLRINVIRPVLCKLFMFSEAAENLLLVTAAQESRLGYYLRQVSGPALGLYQIEPNTHNDVWDNFLAFKPELKATVASFVIPANAGDKKQDLITNLAYATAIARIIYYRVSERLPDANDVEGLASYWKRHYNTAGGAGSVDECKINYTNLVLGRNA